jgi:hypothetical protein
VHKPTTGRFVQGAGGRAEPGSRKFSAENYV